MPNQIPTIFKPTGVSFCQNVINSLQKGQVVNLVPDPTNKYDSNAIKIMTEDEQMCGFVPRKFKIKISDEEEEKEIELNKILLPKLERMQKKYNLKIYEIYKWDGPTGYEVMFEKKTT